MIRVFVFRILGGIRLPSRRVHPAGMGHEGWATCECGVIARHVERERILFRSTVTCAYICDTL